MAVLTWHPFAERFPLLEGDEREALKASIRSTKGVQEEPVLYRMKDGKPQGLDGRNRHVLCRELKIKCKMKRVSVPDDEVKAFILRRNLHRRHLTKELRQELVAEMVAEGESVRTIAGTLGVSVGTVQGDKAQVFNIEHLTPENAGEKPDAPEKVTGADGKSYPATKPPAKPKTHEIIPELRARSLSPKLLPRIEAMDGLDQISVEAFIAEGNKNPLQAVVEVETQIAARDKKPTCYRCQREGEVKGCPACKDMRRQTDGGTKPQRTSKPEEPGTAPKDAFGNDVPKRCRDVWADPWIQDTYDLLTVTSEKIRTARISEGMRKRAKRLPFFQEKDFVDGVGFIVHYLDQLIDHVKDNRPAGVCPKCDGKGCSDCRGHGLVPRKLYGELVKAKKAEKVPS